MTTRPPALEALYGTEVAGEDGATVRAAFTTGEIPVAVYGLGKMGLPLATVFADVTGNVTGVDLDTDVVSAINDGDCPVADEPGLPSALEGVVDRDALRATTDGDGAARGATVHVVIVPTLVEAGEPDLSMLDAAVRTIASGLDAGDLVIVESTVPPRTCRDRVRPLLAAESGLDTDEFGLAFCPERTMSGRALADIRGAHPKVVGGVDAESTRLAELLYSEVTTADIHPVSDATTAECVKVFEGLYRDVNIALANELATLTDEFDVDVTEAIEIANTQPFCDIHSPGPGVGGHCIPYYPYFVIAPFETPTPMLETAREVNDAMPAFTVDKLADRIAATGGDLGESTVLVLGLAYRAGVDETRASPGMAIAERLAERAATVFACDPVTDDRPPADVEMIELPACYDVDPDGIVLTTPHDAFETLDWGRFDDLVVIDGHRSCPDAARYHDYYAIGRGSPPGE